ncbi:MAG: LysR family transcriptional regulator, partial [Robiginitomaculum sp.]|nr:LysR family transcriptional regulator [Robiginitomaculum sp.]
MDKRKMETLPLEWIRVFEAAGRNGSFTAAAVECGLTQAAVSQRIRNLEARIGADLFTRQARGVTLTVEGEAWLPYVSSALQALNRSANELFGAPLKKLVISTSASVAQLWIVPRLAQLNRGAAYQISINTVTIEGDYAKSNAAIEVRYGRGRGPEVDSAQLYQEQLTPVAAPSLLQSGVRWQDLPLIAVSGPRAGWQEWAAQMEDASLPVPQFRFDTFA